MKDYSDLPDFMESDEISAEVCEILEIAQSNENSCESIEVAEALLEMAIRQCNNYTPFSHKIIEKIENWLIREWSTENIELFEIFCSLVVNLQSSVGVELLRQACLSKDSTIRGLAELALSEI